MSGEREQSAERPEPGSGEHERQAERPSGREHQHNFNGRARPKGKIPDAVLARGEPRAPVLAAKVSAGGSGGIALNGSKTNRNF